MFNKTNDYFKKYPEILNLLLFTFGACFIIYFVNNFIGIFAPFIIAYIIAIISKPMVNFFSTKLKFPRVLASIFSLLIIVCISACVIWFFMHNIINGLSYLIDLISREITTQNILVFISNIEEKLMLLEENFNFEIDLVKISDEVYGIAMSIVKVLSNLSLNMVMNIPSFVISFIIGCIASFYMVFDYTRISNFFNKQFSEKTKKIVEVFNTNILFSIFKLVISYSIISFICFLELVMGFYVLGIKDALFIAFIIAIIDVFPIVGSGAILVPWGILLMISQNFVIGIGLIILWCIIVVVRQILEPKIVGSQIGLHPLATIMAMFIGLQTMGGLGLLIGPLYVIICKKLNEADIIKLYK